MVGQYNGVKYKRVPHCQVFPHADKPLKRLMWFICDGKMKPTGSHFDTKREMICAIDEGITE